MRHERMNALLHDYRHFVKINIVSAVSVCICHARNTQHIQQVFYLHNRDEVGRHIVVTFPTKKQAWRASFASHGRRRLAEHDRVSFTASDGSIKSGVIIRLNKKTVSLRTDDDQLWKVSPSFLRK